MSDLLPMIGLRFRLRYPNGESHELLVDAERALIGSGAHCEIRLPSDHAASESVLVQHQDGRAYAQARSLDPRPLLDGAPLTEAALEPESVLRVGGVEISMAIIDDAGEGKRSSKQERRNILSYALLGVVCLALAFIATTHPFDDPEANRPGNLPTIWDPPPTSCPQRATDLALNLAYTQKLIAEGKRERSPFDVRDGVAAVPLFELAAVCFQYAGDGKNAAEMRQSIEKLKKQIDMDYRVHQMRLLYALDNNNVALAEREVEALLTMLHGKEGPHVSWLSNLARRLKLSLTKPR